MSEQHSEPVSSQAGADMAAKSEPVMAAAQTEAHVQAPSLSPDQEETAPKADAPKMDAPKVEPPPLDAARFEPDVEPVNMETPKVETGSREEPRFPGKLMIMAPGNRAWDRSWDHEETASKPAAEQPAKSSGRFAAMAAVIALATVAGAIGGALATAGFSRVATPAVASAKDTGGSDMAAKDSAREAAIARIESEITSLKASVEQTAKSGQAQFNRANDRLEKVEKAQAEPMAKLAKLTETVDKLRATPQAPTTTAAATPATARETPARETTGTVTPQTAAATPAAAAPKTEVGRLPVLDGWALRDVGNGGALIEGRGGIYEVYAGDPVPGLGRVDAIRRQDGRWVVVTSRGLIVSR